MTEYCLPSTPSARVVGSCKSPVIAVGSTASPVEKAVTFSYAKPFSTFAASSACAAATASGSALTVIGKSLVTETSGIP